MMTHDDNRLSSSIKALVKAYTDDELLTENLLKNKKGQCHEQALFALKYLKQAQVTLLHITYSSGLI